jgi:hypothetical protein
MTNLADARERLRLLQAARAAYRALKPIDRDLFRAEMEAEASGRAQRGRARDALGAMLKDASALTAKRKTTRMTYRDAVLRVLVDDEPLGSSAIASKVENMMPDANSVSVQAEVNRMLKDKLVTEGAKTPQGFIAYKLTASGTKLAAERTTTKEAG